MAKVSQSEITQALGKASLEGAKLAAKETAKERMEGSSREKHANKLKDLIYDLTNRGGDAQPLVLALYRKPAFGTTMKYVGKMTISLADLKTAPLEELISNYSGGGEYQVKIIVSDHDIEETVYINIDGDPLPPADKRNDLSRMASMSPYGLGQGGPPGMGYGRFGGGGPGGWNQPPPLSPYNPYYQQQQPPWASGPPKEPDSVAALAMMMVKQSSEQRPVSSEPDPMVEALREQNQQLQRQMEAFQQQFVAAEERRQLEARQAEERRRHEDQIEEMRRQQEKLEAKLEAGSNKKSSTMEMLEVLAPLVAPLVPALLERSDKNAEALKGIYEQMNATQANSTNMQLEAMKMSMAQPKSEERIARLTEAMGSFMAQQIGMTGSLITNFINAQAGDQQPIWAQIVQNVLEQGSDIAKAMISGGFEAASDEDEEYEVPALRPPIMASAQVEPGEHSGLEAGRAAQLALVQGGKQDEETEERVAGLDEDREGLPQMEAFDTAMQTILTQIATGGEPRAIAFKLWKHAVSGVQAAVQWFENPVEGTAFVLGGLRERGEISITDERIEAVAAAVLNLYEYLARYEDLMEGAEAYRKEFAIPVKMPKAIRVVVPSAMVAEGVIAAKPAVEEDEEAEPEELAEEGPSEEPVDVEPAAESSKFDKLREVNEPAEDQSGLDERMARAKSKLQAARGEPVEDDQDEVLTP